MRALALLLVLIAMPALAQEQRPPVDVRFEFEKLAAQMEVLLDRPLDEEMRKALRERLASIVTRLEAGRADDNAAQIFRLERRLARNCARARPARSTIFRPGSTKPIAASFRMRSSVRAKRCALWAAIRANSR